MSMSQTNENPPGHGASSRPESSPITDENGLTIQEWAQREYPDIFPLLPSHESMVFRDVDPKHFAHPPWSSAGKVPKISKLLYVGTIKTEDKREVYALKNFGDGPFFGGVSLVTKRDVANKYEVIDYEKYSSIKFVHPFSSITAHHDDITPLDLVLRSTIRYFFQASGNLVKPGLWDWPHFCFTHFFDDAMSIISRDAKRKRAAQRTQFSNAISRIPDTGVSTSKVATSTNGVNTVSQSGGAGPDHSTTTGEKRRSVSNDDEVADGDIQHQAITTRPSKRLKAQQDSQRRSDENPLSSDIRNMATRAEEQEEGMKKLQGRIKELEERLRAVEASKDELILAHGRKEEDNLKQLAQVEAEAKEAQATAKEEQNKRKGVEVAAKEDRKKREDAEKQVTDYRSLLQTINKMSAPDT